MNGLSWAFGTALKVAGTVLQAGDPTRKTKKQKLAEWREQGNQWSKYVRANLAVLGADTPTAKRRSDRDDARLVREMRQQTGGGPAFEAWKEAHVETQSIKEELASVLGETGELADEIIEKVAAGKEPSGALSKMGDQGERIRELLRQLESAEIEERALAQLALYGDYICSTDMKDWCESLSDEDTDCTFVSNSTDEPWSPPDEKGEGGGGAAPDDEAVDVEDADAADGSAEPSLSDEEAQAEGDAEPSEPEGATPSREVTEEPSAESKPDEAVSPDGTNATQETKSVAKGPKVPPPPPPYSSALDLPGTMRPEGSTHTFGRPAALPPPPPPIGPLLLDKWPVQPPGAPIQETVTIAFLQQPPRPPPRLPPPLLPPEGAFRGLPGQFDPDAGPPPLSEIPEEPPPPAPGIYLDDSAVDDILSAAAIDSLNKALVECGLGWMMFDPDPRTKKLTLVLRTGGEVDPNDPRLAAKPAARDLVRLVNMATSVMTFAVVDDAFSVGTKYGKRTEREVPLREDVALTMAQPGEDGVFYFNIESFLSYRTKPSVKNLVKGLNGKDPLNPVAMFYHEVVEAAELAEWRDSQPDELRLQLMSPAQNPPSRALADPGHDRAHDMAIAREAEFRFESKLPGRARWSAGDPYSTDETAKPGHEHPSTLRIAFHHPDRFNPARPDLGPRRWFLEIENNESAGFKGIRISGG